MQTICGRIKYSCIKCSKPVQLDVIQGIQEQTVEFYRSIFDAKLCTACHCDKSAEKLAECMVM